VSFTLSHKDPRYQLNQFYKGECLTGMHGFISFAGDPRSNFDATLIPYLIPYLIVRTIKNLLIAHK
jgi:hypothetical protein